MKILKRTIAIVLAVALLLPVSVFSADEKKVTVTADGFNTERGSGALIIYTSEMGETTGTNLWGNEIIVVDNVATEFSEGNSTIPENGFVLSGHNENANDPNASNMGLWIQNNISLGDYVYYTPNGIVTVSDVPVAASLFYSIDNKINGVNISRSTDSLVVYNNSGSTTGTNEWGYEVVVTDGVVTALGGNNNIIPEGDNSFVVSGHGESSTWIQKNVQLGMQVTYNNADKSICFDYNEDSAISEMQILLEELNDYYDVATKRYDYFDYNAVRAELDKLASDLNVAETAYRSTNDSAALADAYEAFVLVADELSLSMSESRPVEYRGVWIRPTDTSAEQVDATVQELYENGINMICIETLYDNTMIMPMPEDSLFEVNPKFAHYDMLQAYIDSCHKRGMELHLWLPVFHVGTLGTANDSLSVGAKKPEWLSLSNTGESYEIHDNFYMLDPGNQEVQDYLITTYQYILETYDVDGLQLDYIRYGARSSSADMGYNQAALDAFEEEYGQVPKYNTLAPYWSNWVEFRAQYITDFVGRVRELIDTVAPDVLLGADVVSNAEDGMSYYYQDWTTWLENGWLDILFPMAYGYGHEENIINQVEKCGDDTFLAVGLGIYMSELDASVMQEQTNYNNTVFAEGSVYFEATAYLKKGTGEYLKKGVYANDAITPTYDKLAAAKAQIEYAKGRITDIIVPLGGVSEDGAQAVIEAIDNFANTITEKGFDEKAYAKIATVIDDVDMTSEASERVKKDIAASIKAYLVTDNKTDNEGISTMVIIIVLIVVAIITITVVLIKKKNILQR